LEVNPKGFVLWLFCSLFFGPFVFIFVIYYFLKKGKYGRYYKLVLSPYILLLFASIIIGVLAVIGLVIIQMLTPSSQILGGREVSLNQFFADGVTELEGRKHGTDDGFTFCFGNTKIKAGEELDAGEVMGILGKKEREIHTINFNPELSSNIERSWSEGYFEFQNDSVVAKKDVRINACVGVFGGVYYLLPENLEPA
jgi:hypothetical protein